MTATVTEATRQVILANPLTGAGSSLSLIVIGLLVVLLILKEVIRILGRPALKARLRTLDIAIIPLLFTFSVIVIKRLIDFLPAS